MHTLSIRGYAGVGIWLFLLSHVGIHLHIIVIDKVVIFLIMATFGM